MLLPHFELPEHIPQPQGNGSTSVAAMLAQYYTVLLYPFEDAYKKNIQDQQRKAARQMGVQNPQHMSPMHPNNAMSPRPNPPNMMGVMGQGGPQQSAANGRPQVPQSPQTPLPSSTQFLRTPTQGTPQGMSASLSGELGGMTNQTVVPDVNVLDQDAQGLKRKLEPDEGENKRARLKTAGSEPPESSSTALMPGDRKSLNTPAAGAANSSQPTMMPRPRTQPSRRKIEYVPMAREVDTYGGRDLQILQDEMMKMPLRRWRPIESWGIIDIEALTMSIRSGLPTEVSYALTTLLNLAEGPVPTPANSQAPGPQPSHPPFSLAHCPDLTDELLDLVENTAFEGIPDTSNAEFHVHSHREIVESYMDAETELFAGLRVRQGTRDPKHGPQPRPGHTIMTVTALFRSLAGNQERVIAPDNPEFLARHERFLDVMLRLCMVERAPDGMLRASSPVLSLADVVRIRKDLLYTLFHLALMIQLPSPTSPSESTLRMANRLFQVVAAYFVDPNDALTPSAIAAQTPDIDPLSSKPSFIANVALDVFTKMCLYDTNRQIFANAIPHAGIWQMMDALAHRLPVATFDFTLMTQHVDHADSWQSFIERVIMTMYSLAFLSPPELKKKLKSDTTLRLPNLIFKLVQRLIITHHTFQIPARRAVEMLKVLDDGQDLFDTSESTVPTMSFGMGYGEAGESASERGTGALAGVRSTAWELMLGCRDVDPLLFSELDLLSRVELAA
ncbi:hypothetical protein HGRIS_007743 [Hohenbuehelia grisea]